MIRFSKNFLEINAHAHTVDTRCSFFPSPFSAPGNEAISEPDPPAKLHLHGQVAVQYGSSYITNCST